YVDGRINLYIRSGFTRKPTEQFSEQWQVFKQLFI
ncbi:MAG TPA: nucleoid occlusion factor SlmA, partial [Alteromonas australica]|nr:nucleoid occlusion factor SlmA [Alteromonas australica]HBU51141.1 nucleoid occlusion factor SlmA [Alteromonas australica]